MAELQFPKVPFGRPMRNAHFNFAPSYTPLNHGSYGTYPTAVRNRLRHCQELAEAKPDLFIRWDIPLALDSSRAALASFLSVSGSEVVLVPNATTGVNVVLRSLKYEQGDVILHFSTLYGACQKTVWYICETTKAESEAITVRYPCKDERVVEDFVTAIRNVNGQPGKRVRVAIFDTITALPGVRVPWERLCEVCRDEDVMSLVDGAHGIGHISLDLKGADPDFFVSNCHKWLYVPRGCAVFYVPERNQHLIRTALPTSHGFVPVLEKTPIYNPLAQANRSRFVQLFQFAATIDASPYLCIKEALDFRRNVCGGEKSIMDYCQQTALEGGRKAIEILGTEMMEDTMMKGCMFANVRLPLDIGDDVGEIKEQNAFIVLAWIARRLVADYDTFMAPYLHGGYFWVRISGQIYLEVQDIEWGARILKELCRRARIGEYLQIKAQL